MQASSWLKSQDLFERSILLDTFQREELLQQECGQDIELFEQMLRLLDAHDNAPSIMRQFRYKQLSLSPKDLSHQLVGPYQILSKLGSGGMGVVYKAYDIRLERYLALKFLPHDQNSDEKAKKRLLREAKAASALSHQHLCTVYDIEQTNEGQIYIAMAYYEGKNFDKLIEEGAISLQQALTATQQISNGLIAAHEKSIIHRDIKPANLILNGNRGIKILDFGIAKFADMQNTDTAIQGGTVAYMSPEHIRGEKLDLRTDIWSTAIILYEMISGKKPFVGNSLPETMHRVLQDATPRLSKKARGVPKSLDKIIFKALSKEIEDRYQTMGEFLGDLDLIVEELYPKRVTQVGHLENAHDSSSKDDLSPAIARKSAQADDVTVTAHPIEVICAAISMANYDDLNNTLQTEVFQQLVGLYLKGVKQRVSQHKGLIKTLVGNTIVCEFNYIPEEPASSLRAISAAHEIHGYIQDISAANDIELNCFVTMTEFVCSEINILDCARHISELARPAETFATDAVYQSLKSAYSGTPMEIDFLGSPLGLKTMWQISHFQSADGQAEISCTPDIGYQENSSIDYAPAPIIPEDFFSNTGSNSQANSLTNMASSNDPIPDFSDKKYPVVDTEEDSKITPLGNQLTAPRNKFSLDSASDLFFNVAAKISSPFLPSIDSAVEQNEYQCSYTASETFIGRENLLADTELILANSLSNRKTHYIHFSGADGVGKTRLALEIQAMAKQLGYTEHHHINTEFGADEGLQMFCKLSKSILSHNSGEAINAELSLLDYAITNNYVKPDLLVYLYDLLGLTPDKTLDAKPMASEYARWIEQHDLVLQELFSTAVQKSPLIILTDDLQWADPLSIKSLIGIIASCRSEPIVVVSTSDRSASPIESLLKQNLRKNQFSIFELAALNHQQSEKLVSQHADIPKESVDTLLRCANGMPLKVMLMVQYYKDFGKTDFPSSIADLVKGNLSTFPADDIQALWAASTIGGIFSQSCIRYLIENQDYQCQRLVDLGIISPYGKLYIFAHPLIHAAVYETMEDDTKHELHNQAAEWYAYVDYSIRAEHLDKSNSDEAIDAYLKAATNLFDIVHLEYAIKCAERGLELATLANDDSAIEQLSDIRNKIKIRQSE